jgi:predicted dinucleotide-binding enzyme
MNIAFIGYGSMTTALAGKFVAAGHECLISGRDPDKAAALADQLGDHAAAKSQADAVQAADVVIIATPHQAALSTIDDSGGPDAFAGKVIVDINNPVPGYAEGDFSVATYDGKSLSEAIAAKAPDAHVVKAFNLCQAKLWATPSPILLDGRQHTTPFCGDDESAKAKVATLIEAVGSEPVDMGELHYARQLEAMASLVIKLLFSGRDPMTCFQLIQPEKKPIA